MENLFITPDLLLQNTIIANQTTNQANLRFPASGGGIRLPQLLTCPERFLVFSILVREDHSVPMNLNVYSKENPAGQPCFDVRFGVMPGIRTLICIDLTWLDAHVLFPEHSEGQLKVVCHGGRIERSETDRITLMNFPSFHDLEIELSDLILTDAAPDHYPLPAAKLIDEMGQYKLKDWPQKVRDTDDLSRRLQDEITQLPDRYTIPDWSIYGGWSEKRLSDGSGFFSRSKQDGKWWLVDPLGYAFFSMGPDCVVARSDCRIDGLESFMDWLPDRDDPAFGSMYEYSNWPRSGDNRRQCTTFSFEQANLYRAFGENWYEHWISLISRQLKNHGMNTLGNWSDYRILGKTGMPYVTMLHDFPSTNQLIFRDFPDVLSQEYREHAAISAQELLLHRDDPYMIGYFLRNEPSWAFVDNLVIADEVLYNPAHTVSKDELIAFLKNKYNQDIANLNLAWHGHFKDFTDLYTPLKKVSGWSGQAKDDMRAFSRKMLEAYVGIPSEACRLADPNHMNLGMRWAWISDPDVVTGWEHFDVFSINCYAADPTSALDQVQKLAVDLPVMIGEFHFGALDSGLTATGLEGVLTQADRGKAYRYYCERVAAHPNGVGCHYFQCYDQFALGRFDGENYNIGLFDICSQPYHEMMTSVRACSESIYRIANGQSNPTDQMARSIPMIAY